MYILICVCVSIFPVRLVDGLTNHEGTVEVYHNGVWGTVCDDGWDWNNAQVVCSELDLGYAVAAIPNAFYGQGSGQIWLDDVNCVGNELSLIHCSHSGWGSHNCSHGNDASVNCNNLGWLLLITTSNYRLNVNNNVCMYAACTCKEKQGH